MIKIVNTLNIEKIIQDSGLDINAVAAELFPKNKYPTLALNRVFANESQLDVDQLAKLAALLGVPTYRLLRDNTWEIKSKGKDVLEMRMGDYKVLINYKENNSKIFHKGSLFHETLLHKNSIPLSQYISSINQIINTHKDGN